MFRINDTVEKKKEVVGLRIYVVELVYNVQPNTNLPRKYNGNPIIKYDDRDRHFSPGDWGRIRFLAKGSDHEQNYNVNTMSHMC